MSDDVPVARVRHDEVMRSPFDEASVVAEVAPALEGVEVGRV